MYHDRVEQVVFDSQKIKILECLSLDLGQVTQPNET